MTENKLTGKTVVLIEVEERDISEPMFFETWDQARDEMMARFKKASGLTDEDIGNAVLAGQEEKLYAIDEDTYFNDSMACCQSMGQNYDWKIFEI